MPKPKADARRAPHPARLLMQIRQLHVYVGMLIAPSLLFFAVTGVLQIYSLHEAHPGYTPPPLIEKLGSTHKDQEFALGHKGPPPGAKKPGEARPAGAPDAPHAEGQHADAAPAVKAQGPADAPHGPPKHRGPSPATVALKAFFALVSVGLIGSTLTGIWMALKYNKARRACWVMLILGVIIPTALTLMTAG